MEELRTLREVQRRDPATPPTDRNPSAGTKKGNPKLPNSMNIGEIRHNYSSERERERERWCLAMEVLRAGIIAVGGGNGARDEAANEPLPGGKEDEEAGGAVNAAPLRKGRQREP